MMKKGFVKFNRKIKDWGWYTDVNTFKLFFHLILCANYTDGTFLGVKILRGQIATSISKLAKETGLTQQNVRTALKHLESTGEITRNSTRNLTSNLTHAQRGNFSVISIPNYDLYQSDQHTIQQANSQAANIRLTRDQHATNTQANNNIRINKNNKNNKNERKKEEPFVHSAEKNKLKIFGGKLGGGVVLLSEEQEDKLLEMLSVEEFDKYVSIVRDCELAGKHFRKPHYQAILEMVNKDRGM